MIMVTESTTSRNIRLHPEPRFLVVVVEFAVAIESMANVIVILIFVPNVVNLFWQVRCDISPSGRIVHAAAKQPGAFTMWRRRTQDWQSA